MLWWTTESKAAQGPVPVLPPLGLWGLLSRGQVCLHVSVCHLYFKTISASASLKLHRGVGLLPKRRMCCTCLESEVKVVSGTARLKRGSGEAWRFAMVTPSCHQASGEMAPPLFPTTWATLGSILSNSRLGLRFCAHSGTSLLPPPLLSQLLGDTKDWIVSHFRPSRQALVGNLRGCLPLCI